MYVHFTNSPRNGIEGKKRCHSLRVSVPTHDSPWKAISQQHWVPTSLFPQQLFSPLPPPHFIFWLPIPFPFPVKKREKRKSLSHTFLKGMGSPFYSSKILLQWGRFFIYKKSHVVIIGELTGSAGDQKFLSPPTTTPQERERMITTATPSPFPLSPLNHAPSSPILCHQAPTTTFFPKTKSPQMSIRYLWVKSTDLPFPTIFLQMARKFPTQYILHWAPCSVRLYIHPTCLIFFEGFLLLTYWGFSSSPA